MKVMIVDDHADMRRMLKNNITLFFSEDVVIIECESGEEAVVKYPNFMPDFVLMDFQLGGMNGFEATKNIINYDSKAKVIIVTSYDSPSMRSRAEKVQSLGFICKDDLSGLYQLMQNITNSL